MATTTMITVERKDLQPEPLTLRDVRTSWLRWYILAEMSNSYERLQSLAFCAALAPILKKLYKNKEDLSAALKRHLTFFNTQADWGAIIPGLTIAMEEQKAHGADIPDDMITGIKTGLMGPLAGIGDTVDWGTIKPIILGLFIPSAMNGSWMAPLLVLFIFTAITAYESYFMWTRGYSLGRESIASVLESGWVQQLITGAGVLGLFMMGALSANFVKVSTPAVIVIGESNPLQIQAILDKIAPGLLSLATVMGLYLYMTKKGPKILHLMLVLLAIAIVGSVLKIL